MKYKKKYIILILLFVLFCIFYSGCVSVIPDSPTDPEIPLSPPNIGPTSGWLVIEDDLEITKDCTPILSIYSEGADYMSFSGDGENWTEWIGFDNSYNEFNIANGLNGTKFGSGIKYVYVRFKDEDGNLSPSDKLAFDIIEYEMGELFSIKIIPQEVTISVSSSYVFTLHGYDLKLNEVPLENSKVTWTKCCGVGELYPITGLSTTYTAPSVAEKRNITAHYGNLKTGAVIIVVKEE